MMCFFNVTKIYMKRICLLLTLVIFSANTFAQHSRGVVKGAVYGRKPGTTGTMMATKLEGYMGKKTRLATVIIGRVIKVTKTEGGWFEIDGGNGTVISAHFATMVNVPSSLAGHTCTIDGTAEKQFIADDEQHLAGNIAADKQRNNPKANITFEVLGLRVD